MRTADSLPHDRKHAMLVGRIWDPALAGPTPVLVRGDQLIDISSLAPTMSGLLDMANLADRLRAVSGPSFALGPVIANSTESAKVPALPWLIAPNDLQTVKASGVTFVASLLERVIEERAAGDAARANALRETITRVLGDNLAGVVPGSEAAAEVKKLLIAEGAWSQYLEVGIGPDAEVFTKAAPMSSVGYGANVGIHPRSEWNNPEPEIVLAVNRDAQVVGAALGNDVNLRDFEGRSALLLGKAKDNNGSCAIGPFIRLFDPTFTIDDIRAAEVRLEITGDNGFRLEGSSAMSLISRDPLDLVNHAAGKYHQYPDGFMLFLGTMFAPTQDRDAPGQGFTHHRGDIVTVSSPKLGALVNRVDHCDRIAPWSFGIRALIDNLGRRNLLRSGRQHEAV